MNTHHQQYFVVKVWSRHCPHQYSWQKQYFLARLLRVGLFKTYTDLRGTLVNWIVHGYSKLLLIWPFPFVPLLYFAPLAYARAYPFVYPSLRSALRPLWSRLLYTLSRTRSSSLIKTLSLEVELRAYPFISSSSYAPRVRNWYLEGTPSDHLYAFIASSRYYSRPEKLILAFPFTTYSKGTPFTLLNKGVLGYIAQQQFWIQEKQIDNYQTVRKRPII